MRARQPAALPRRQRGVAIITALLLTTLAVTIVASLFWQQQVQVRSMENQRLHLQTKWILRGALDWATLVLRQDGLDNRSVTSLTAVWNTPLAETRLDQYIERERVEGEIFNATLSGRIIDATSRYNLTNLATGPLINKQHVDIYKRLLTNLRIDSTLAQKTAEAVRDSANQLTASEGGPPVAQKSKSPLALTQLDDLLSIPGYTPEIVEKLREFVIVLPAAAETVNVNTAPAEVLSALSPNLPMSAATSLVGRRKQAYFRYKTEFEGQLFGADKPDQLLYDVKSSWFLVISRVRLDRAALDAEALVSRDMTDPSMTTKTVWVRQN